MYTEIMKISPRRRLGFILSTVHTGSALELFHKLVEKVRQEDDVIFIFPGGKLGVDKNDSFPRNDIYKLANSSNVDGIISWASSISGSVPVQEIEKFHKRFVDIPFVTIGQKIPGHPCVEFDAYTGMKELVRHLIEVHEVKKIAFLRGPSSHTSAEERYRAYKDALIEANIAWDENLTTEPFEFDSGAAGAVQLCEERGLVPGRDFEALVSASDLMAFAAVAYLERKGARIPKDLLVAGFNDTNESRFANPSFSTVHMPRAELAEKSYEKIKEILGGLPAVSDVNIPSYPVIRESCGCVTQSKIWFSDAKSKIRTKERFAEEVYRIFMENPQSKKFEQVIRALFEKDKVHFYESLTQLLTVYFENNGELLNLFKALSLLRNLVCLDQDYIEKIIRNVTVLIPRIQEKVAFEKRYEMEKTNKAISALKNDLLSVFDRKKLVFVLKEHLLKVGVEAASFVLYTDDDAYSNYIGGFNASGEIRTDAVRFPREFLVPEGCSSDFEKGAFIVQPLFVEGSSYGYMICSYSDFHGVVYEDLRSSVSSVLKSIFLFEQTNEAKRIAEQAEFAKTEFFANVGSDLCDPLRNISAKVQQMEENIEKELLDKDIITEQLLFIRSQIDAQLEKTETLVDLTRSQIDDLPVDKKLFDIRQSLPVSVAAGLNYDFPLLYGDSERLKRALQTIFEFVEKMPCVSEKTDGIHIEFYSNRFNWQKPELLLAEKIILLQYGNVVKSKNYAEVILPWPNFMGSPGEVRSIETARFYRLSENSSRRNFPDSKYLFDKNVRLSELENVVLLWEPDTASIDEWVKVYGLRHIDSLFRAPLICHSHNLIGHDFVDILEQKIKTQRTDSVLFVGAKHTHYDSWATDANSISISSMEEFDKILMEITPSLIVFESIDESSIRRIRQNQKTVLVPIIVLPDSVSADEEIELLCSHPRIILCNRGAAESEQFNERIKGILAGDDILPPHTGALVKKAILYLNRNASQQIVRWKLADTVHVSEDYLTRIFHKELGLSLWEYLNRYRMYMATKMLLETNDTIYEIAENSGFQDQAYFCRVFKKIYGVPPGKIRSK